MRNVTGPGGFDVLFYDGVRNVKGPGGPTSYSMMA